MHELLSKHFKNGSVYGLMTDDSYPIEVTDTFLPYNTKFCINGTNSLQDYNIGSRAERWMIGVSCMSGCPVGCKFCATGQLKRWINLSELEILEQIQLILNKNEHLDPLQSKEFKINYTRMGEPFLNLQNIKSAIHVMSTAYPNTHHYLSTIGIRGSDFSWIEGNITLQISLHSLDEDRRHELIPFGKALMSIEELGQIRTKSNLKTTINLTLVDSADFEIDKLRQWFDPKYFFIKLSPVNTSKTSIDNGISEGLIKCNNLY